jgi:hypothetical protein
MEMYQMGLRLFVEEMSRVAMFAIQQVACERRDG